jgi:hypothetical protein
MTTNFRIVRVALPLMILAGSAVWLGRGGHSIDAMAAQKATEPLIAKDSIQVTLRTHHDFYRGGQRDESAWSWTPKIKYRVNGPIASGGQLSVEFTLPGNRPWVKFDCQTGQIDAGFWWDTECGNNDVPDEKAVTDTGVVGLTIKLRNELAGADKTLFSGKMEVAKFHYGLDLPKFKNNFVYYVNYDWNLPIGYIFLEGERDAHSSKIDWTFPEFKVAMWFKGTEQTTNKVDAYLFYQGQEVGNTASSEKGAVTDDVIDLGSESSPNEWRRKKFHFNTVRGWDRQPQYHIKAHLLNKNPGDYEIKVLENGHLVRIAKFTVAADGKFGNGNAQTNGLGSERVVIPVQIVGDQDGAWDKDAWRTKAFFGNSLSGFQSP